MALLIDGDCINILPTLAEIIGLHESIELQRLHEITLDEARTVEEDGDIWVRATQDELRASFSFFKADEIKTAIKNLIDMKLLKKDEPFYAINYKLVESLEKSEKGSAYE